MIDKLRSLLGDDEVPPPPKVRETVNHFTNSDYFLRTETIRNGDSAVHTVRAGFEVAGYSYEPSDTVAGVLRSYDGSITEEANLRDYISDHGQMPVDEDTGNPSPDHILRGAALVPGEFIEDATDAQYLAIPIWEDEA